MSIYRSALINRKTGLTANEFRQHWIEIHGSLASKLPGVGTYRQNHIVERFYENLEPPVQSIDGISQLLFESVRHMEISDASPEYAAVKADIPQFQGGITILVLEAEAIFEKPQPEDKNAYKLLWISTRKDKDSGDFRAAWRNRAHSVAQKIPGLKKMVQNWVIDRGHPVHAGVPAGDAGRVESVSEMWFSSLEELHAAVASKQAKEIISDDPALRAMAIYRIEEIFIIK